MASSKEYLEYVLESFRDEDVTYRPMMGEYLLYYRGKLFGVAIAAPFFLPRR